MRIVYQDERSAVIGGEIAGADVLAVAAKIGDAEGAIIENADEPGRPAAVLHIRPAVLGDSRHIEAVALGDERRLGGGEAAGRPVAFEVRPEFAAAVGLLRGAHGGGRGDIEKIISHGATPLVRTESNFLKSQ